MNRPRFNPQRFVPFNRHDAFAVHENDLALERTGGESWIEQQDDEERAALLGFSQGEYDACVHVLRCVAAQSRQFFECDEGIAELRSLVATLSAHVIHSSVARAAAGLERPAAVKRVSQPEASLEVVVQRAATRVSSFVHSMRQLNVAPPALGADLRSFTFLSELARRGSSAPCGASRAAKQDLLALIADLPVPAELLVEAANTPRCCMQCSAYFFTVSPRYAVCCEACAERNLFYRDMTFPLHDTVAVLTGARIKIGFAVAVKLLDAGASLVATSRFPFALARRLATHANAPTWGTRLRVLGCDFRDTASVQRMCAFLHERLDHIDFLINNAAQTIRKPAAAYSRLAQQEMALAAAAPLSEFERHATAFHRDFAARDGAALSAPALQGVVALVSGDGSLHRSALSTQAGVCEADARSQVLFGSDSWSLPTFATEAGVLVDDGADLDDFRAALESQRDAPPVADTRLALTAQSEQFVVLPPSQPTLVAPPRHTATAALGEAVRLVQESQEPLDLRRNNSWMMTLEQVELGEWMEVLTVNAAVPSLLCTSLLPLLQRSALPERHVIMVSSMEAKFMRFKAPAHPHTNAGKAALNMITRTCGAQWRAQHAVLINSVDTGWVTDERPLSAQVRDPNAYPNPLDEIDGAARILQPIWRSCAESRCCTDASSSSSAEASCCWAHKLAFGNAGNFLKDFTPSLW